MTNAKPASDTPISESADLPGEIGWYLCESDNDNTLSMFWDGAFLRHFPQHVSRIPRQCYKNFRRLVPATEVDALKRRIQFLEEAHGMAPEMSLQLIRDLRAANDELKREVIRLANIIAGIQGALADAADVLCCREDGDYGASVRQVVEQRDALRTTNAQLVKERDEARKDVSLMRSGVSELLERAANSETKVTALEAEIERLKQIMADHGTGIGSMRAGKQVEYCIYCDYHENGKVAHRDNCPLAKFPADVTNHPPT
jgi:hypothetical protein